MRRTVCILGTPIDRLNRPEALHQIDNFVKIGGFHQVATANTDFLVNALHDEELRSILLSADLVTPDGMPVVWAARALRSPLPERVAGADIVPEIAALAAKHGYRIFMLGAREQVAQKAAERLHADYPGIIICGCLSPLPDELEQVSHDVVAAIRSVKPDILFVAFGNPKQEKWIHRHRADLKDVPVCMGVGGTFDFLAGEATRAPVWMQHRGLEWFHRLALDPTRLWKRYNRDFWFFGLSILRELFMMLTHRPGGSGSTSVRSAGGSADVTVIGDLVRGPIDQFYAAIDTAFDGASQVRIDLQGVVSVDGEGLGALLDLNNRARITGVAVQLTSLSPYLKRILRVNDANMPTVFPKQVTVSTPNVV